MVVLTDLKGKQIGELTVLQRVRAPKHYTRWRCECSCGNRITVDHRRLIHKIAPKTHCGCKTLGITSKWKVEYHAWKDAIARCHNPKHHGYKRYGAKGTIMCEEWRNDFMAFLNHVGIRPSGGHSLDRIDPFGNYAPGNVRWATQLVQARNKRVAGKMVEDPDNPGERILVSELATRRGVAYQTMRKRLIEEGRWEYDD